MNRHCASFLFSLVPVLSAMIVPSGMISAQEFSLASVFSDSMVLQRERPVRIWGTATANTEVSVDFAGQSKTVTANESGNWLITLDAMQAMDQPQTLSVKNGKTQIDRNDILVGEVWLASGQSNMEWEMQWKPDSSADLPNANHPQLRLLEIAKTTSLQPQKSFAAKWTTCTPESAASFSAVGYYFGLKLHQELGVPVGIIQSAWGGTRIEPWTSMAGLESVPELNAFSKKVRSETPGTDEYNATHKKHIEQTTRWAAEASKAIAQGTAVPSIPSQPPTARPAAGTPTAIYNAMIRPLVPLTIRGAIWYQGESNHSEGLLYTAKKKALLNSWRSDFRDPKLPFYFVQIAPYQYGEEDGQILPRFWVAQRNCLQIPHTGMAVITDIANLGDIHPAKKKEVARRLSLWALANEYGQNEIDPSGPIYKSHSVSGQQVVVKFDHANEGLKSLDEKPLTHFEVAGIDGEFHPAKASIDAESNSVVVQSDAVKEPRQVRFGWDKLAMPNLADADGLPACAFHSHWPENPDLGANLALGKTWKASDPNTYGWNSGLTDGVWGQNAPTCFATGADSQFPKTVTIDLLKPQEINAVTMGVPPIGSTKNVSVSISLDGKDYTDVGMHEFGQGKAERKMLTFSKTSAKYIRLTFPDHHTKREGGYDPNFIFISEVEVYSTKTP